MDNNGVDDDGDCIIILNDQKIEREKKTKTFEWNF